MTALIFFAKYPAAGKVKTPPAEVLSFGSLPKIDTNNKFYKSIMLPVLNKTDWRSGLWI